jgi:hypothetical protein
LFAREAKLTAAHHLAAAIPEVDVASCKASSGGIEGRVRAVKGDLDKKLVEPCHYFCDMTPTENPARLLFDMKTSFAVLVCMVSLSVQAMDYPYVPYNEGKMDPQKTAWPLTEEERKYVLLPEHERRPGREINQHKPAMWPVTPSAGFWGGTSWLDTHANLVKVAQANKGPIDVLLVGDSITMQWGAAWTKHFPTLKTVNIGIGGDKTQNVLWRLD